MQLIHFTPVSGNIKTGPIPVTTSSNHTCPDACPFKSGGCYAKGGPLAIHWQKVSNGERGDTLDTLAQKLRALPPGQLWRHNQAGDLAGEKNAIDNKALQTLVLANKGRKGFTYTHKPIEGDNNFEADNRASVRWANANGFTVNLSANNLAHADHLSALDCGPVVCVVPFGTANTFYTPQGRKGIICPAQQKEGVTCAKCGLCQKVNRSVIIGFTAHGASARKVNQIVQN
jgi:hypothetical protein